MQSFSFEDLLNFHEENVKDLKHNIILIGNREKIDFENLSQYGEVIELSRKELFNY